MEVSRKIQSLAVQNVAFKYTKHIQEGFASIWLIKIK